MSYVAARLFRGVLCRQLAVPLADLKIRVRGFCKFRASSFSRIN